MFSNNILKEPIQLKWYNIGIVVVILLVLVTIQRRFFPEVQVTTHTDTIYVQHTDTLVTIKPVPYEVVLPPDTVFVPADTLELIRRYKLIHKELYTKRYYIQEYKIDTIGTANIKGRVFMNRLDSLEFTYNLRPPTIINTQILANPKNSLYIGAQIGGKVFAPIVLFNNKEKIYYFVSYNLLQGSISGGVLINMNKIKFK